MEMKLPNGQRHIGVKEFSSSTNFMTPELTIQEFYVGHTQTDIKLCGKATTIENC